MNTHIYVLEVKDTDTDEVIFRAESYTAESMSQEVGKAERYVSARLAGMDAEETANEKAEESITNF